MFCYFKWIVYSFIVFAIGFFIGQHQTININHNADRAITELQSDENTHFKKNSVTPSVTTPTLIKTEKVANTACLDDSLISLQEENKALKQALIDAENSVSVPNSDMNSFLAGHFEQEERLSDWADELELNIQDFIFVADFQDVISIESVECKTTVCQVIFKPQDQNNFDERYWKSITHKIYEQSWFRRFTLSSTATNKNTMTVYLSNRIVQ
jgi:hypothetical protein